MEITMNFKNSFFKREIRNDYEVSEKLKKIWAVEIDLLNELLSVCNKHDIKVVVWAGTMLGTVRHQGCIPWDDDIDVALDRENYEKLLKIAPLEFKNPYFFQSALTDKEFFITYARLRNSSTTGIVTGNESTTYNNGIYIDIFPLDGYPEKEAEYRKFIYIKNIYERLLTFYNYPDTKTSIKTVTKILLRKALKKIVSYNSIYQSYLKHMSRYSGNSSKIGMLCHPKYFRDRYFCNAEDLNDVVWMPFEMIKVPVPSNYDAILTNTYGDYMSFPPAEERGSWHEDKITFDPDIPYKEYFKRLYENKKNG